VRRGLAGNRPGHRSRRGREMHHAGAPKHAMKMGVRRQRAATHAMNMAWTASAVAMMVAPLVVERTHLHRQRRSMKISAHLASVVLSFVILTANGFLPVAAQSGPTPQEQMACRGDAGKFCAEHVGKPPQMNACLRANKEKLSEGCRKVVESHGG